MASCRGSGLLTVCVPSPMRFKKRASARNACIGGKLKDKEYSTPAVGTGGRRDERIQDAFTAASKSCPAQGAATKKKKKK